MALPVAGLGFQVAPLRIGLLPTGIGCCNPPPWPIDLVVGAAPTAYLVVVENAQGAAPYEVVTLQIGLDPNSSGANFVTLSAPPIGSGWGTLLGPGDSMLEPLSLACAGAGNGSVVIQILGGEVPSTEANEETAILTIPFTCGAHG